jgi:hypothetical protein
LALLSLSDIMLALEWRQHYEAQLYKAKTRTDWEMTRLMCCYMVAPHMKNKINKPQELFRFDWEDEAVKISDEDKERFAKQRARWDAEMIEKNGGQ